MRRTLYLGWRTAALTAILVVGLVSFTSSQAEARRRSRSFKGSSDLTTTSADPDARGKLKASAKGDDGRFEVSASKLDRKASYEVIVSGVKVASFTTSRGGSGKVRLRAKPHGKDGLLGFDPRGADVVIRNTGGQDVLFGTVPADDSNNAAGDIICCIPDDDGTECEDRTPTECAARGGTISTATSCVPNPCDGSTPPAGGEIVCCLPDDGEAPEFTSGAGGHRSTAAEPPSARGRRGIATECEDRTTAECVAQGGTVVQATSCSPNPCAATPPSDPDIQCCLPDDGAFECEDRTPAECLAQGGVDMGAGTCSPDTCASLPPPASSDVRCCLPDDSGTECEDRSAAECAAQGGVDRGIGVCALDSCTGVTFPGSSSGSDDNGGDPSGKGEGGSN